MSLGESIELSLRQALRKELAGWAEANHIGKLDAGSALNKARVALRALPDSTRLGADAATVFLDRARRTLYNLEQEDESTYGPDERVGVSGEKIYSVRRLKIMLDALDDRTERLLQATRRRKKASAEQGKEIQKNFGSLEDLNRAMAAGLNADGRIVSIVVTVRVAGFADVAVDHFVIDGIHELLTDYVWEDPDLQLAWQSAFRLVVGEMLTDIYVKAHAASSSARLLRVLEAPVSD